MIGSKTTPIVVVLTLCSCADPDAHAARTVFESFQTALFAGDRSALRETLTWESTPALDQVRLDRPDRRRRLCVEAVERRSSGRFDLRVVDPDRPGRPGTYVVVREEGRWRVDLIESLAPNNPRKALVNGGLRVVPADHDRAEFSGIRATSTDPIR